MKIFYYGLDSGRMPVKDFIDELDKPVKAKIYESLDSIKELGFEAPGVIFRQINGKLWEIKIKTTGGGYRLFYVSVKVNIMILLHAYKKQSQKAPRKEIEIATKRLKEVLDYEINTI